MGRIYDANFIYSFMCRPCWHCYNPKEHIDILVGIEVIEVMLDCWLDAKWEVVEVEDSELFIVSLLYCVVVEESSLDEVFDFSSDRLPCFC